jgi:hypothetical protein
MTPINQRAGIAILPLGGELEEGFLVVSLRNTLDDAMIGHHSTFFVIGEQHLGSVEVASSAVVGTVKDVAGQFTLHGEQGIGRIGCAVADISPHQFGEVVDITLDILIDLHVDFHVHSFLLEVIFASLMRVDQRFSL